MEEKGGESKDAYAHLNRTLMPPFVCGHSSEGSAPLTPHPTSPRKVTLGLGCTLR